MVKRSHENSIALRTRPDDGCKCTVAHNAMGASKDVPYVPTPPAVVEAMLKLAKVKSGDYVIDLGCGDGRILSVDQASSEAC